MSAASAFALRGQLAPRGKAGFGIWYGIHIDIYVPQISHEKTRRQINTHILPTDAIDATLAHVAERAAPVRPDPK